MDRALYLTVIFLCDRITKMLNWFSGLFEKKELPLSQTFGRDIYPHHDNCRCMLMPIHGGDPNETGWLWYDENGTLRADDPMKGIDLTFDELADKGFKILTDPAIEEAKRILGNE